MKKRICLIIGSRPNYVKAGPVIQALKHDFDLMIVDSGQHSHNLSLSHHMLKHFNIWPDYRFDLGKKCFGLPHNERFNVMLQTFRDFLVGQWRHIDYVMVFGDVDTALAGALEASQLRLPVIHEEAGLRSREWDLREEYNRIIIDRLSSIHFCPEESAVQNLKRELISKDVYMVGNVMIDSLSQTVSQFPLVENDYIVLTIHRSKNVDKIENLKTILKCVIRDFPDKEIRFFVHPRTQSSWDKSNSEDISKVYGIECFVSSEYPEMIKQIKESYMVITDSGGMQEEAAWLKKRCITIRDSTERPCTVSCGSNYVTHPHYMHDWRSQIKEPKDIEDIPLWDGKASERICEILKDIL